MVEPVSALSYPEQSYIHGDVKVAPGVAIAKGVILGAEPGCQLVISSAVCLGAGVVIQASQGDLIIEPDVSLGSDVLVVGHGRICNHACVGAASTLINPAIAAHQVVPPKSLMEGPEAMMQNGGRPLVGLAVTSHPNGQDSGQQIAAMNGVIAHGNHAVGDSPSNGTNGHGNQSVIGETIDREMAPAIDADSSERSEQGESTSDPTESPHDADEATEETAASGSLANVSHIYGKNQVNQLLNTLFPHRQPLNGASNEDTT
jgi:carbon dioxide concentrating mechanism protein CcmN